MSHINLRKTLCTAALISAAFVGTAALADQRQGTHESDCVSMGPGMIGSLGDGDDLKRFTQQQRAEAATIQGLIRHKYGELAKQMRDAGSRLTEQVVSDQRNDAALNASQQRISELWLQMCHLSLQVQQQLDAVLTKEQRNTLSRGGRGPSR